MMRVNGVEVAARGMLLEACRAAGAIVPAFCHDHGLSRGGHCRSCMVEAGGRMVPACTTPARDGMEVTTEGERLRDYRRDLGELMLAESGPGGEVAEVLAAWGADGTRYGRRGGGLAADRSHPHIHVHPDRCILCRRCVRACEEIQGQFVYAIEGRAGETRLSWGGGPFATSACVSCGACVTACPTDALTDADRERSWEAAASAGLSAGAGGASVTASIPSAGAVSIPGAKPSASAAPPGLHVVRTTCGFCGVGCQLDVRLAGDGVAWVDGSQAAVNRGHLCVKGRYAHGFARHPERLTTPLIRRGGRLEPATWDEAIVTVARELDARRGAVAGLSSSRCTNEENYLFQKWMRAGLGTHDVDCCARVCHAPSAAGMRAAFGTGAATNSFDDIERADLLLVFGANPTAAHPIVGARIRQAALRGATLIVVDPRRTELAAIADLHLRTRPGTNVPLLNAIACAMVEEGLVHREFIAARVEGWDEFRAFILRHTPEEASPITGVPAAAIRETARRYGSAARPMMLHGLGVTEHLQGSETTMLLCNLALLAGAVGRPGTGVNPLRGQNNVQGAADMGCQPDLLPGYADPADPAARLRFEGEWGRKLPTRPGRFLHQMYEAAIAGELRAMVLFGEDVVQSDPDTAHVVRALESLEFLVVQELFPSETTRYAHVVLPGASFLEKDGTFTNGERRIQRVRKALDPPGEARPDWRILCDLMTATGLPQSFAHPSGIMDEIARVAPPFAGVRYDRLEGDGLQWPVPEPGHPGTAILHTGRFPRGRGLLSRVEYVPSPEHGTGLTLVTVRILEHYNTGSMTRRTANVRLAPEDRLEVNPRDAAARGIADGARVRVASRHGEARATALLTERVPEGCVFLTFHFPETGANAVVGPVRDRITGCPQYKVTAVEIAPLSP